jgi:geranylgeranyl diphosphate synthase type I
MDNDQERRGKPTIFAQYAAETTPETGRNLAICVGDIFLFAASELISTNPDDPSTALAQQQLLARELRLVGIGQMEDIRLPETPQPVDQDRIIAMYRAKTARYTISLPLLLAALRTGFDQTTTDGISRASEKLGVVFQIQDDLIGLYGDPAVTGKPVGSDIREGKQTVVRALLMASASSDEREQLSQVFGSTAISDKDVLMVQQMGDRFAVRAQLDQLIESYLTEIAQEPDPEGVIAEITQFLQNRQQ